MKKAIISFVIAMVFNVASLYMMFIDWGKGHLFIPVTIAVAIAIIFHLITIILLKKEEKKEEKKDGEKIV